MATRMSWKRSQGRNAVAAATMFLAAFVATACETDARYRQITDPDTGALAAVVIGMDFTRTSGLPAGFSAAGNAKTYVFGSEVRLEATNLARPAEGHYYALYLAHPADGRYTEVARLTTPPPSYGSLENADSQVQEPFVGEFVITQAVARQVGSANVAEHTEFWVALVPKAGGLQGAPPAAAKGNVPDTLRE